MPTPLTAAEFTIPPIAEPDSELGTLSPAEMEIADREREWDARTGEWNAGARIADDCFCPSCGARGFVGTCRNCSQDMGGGK